jgi:hypothetical protein
MSLRTGHARNVASLSTIAMITDYPVTEGAQNGRVTDINYGRTIVTGPARALAGLL